MTAQPDRDVKRIPEPTRAHGLSKGAWELRGGIRVFVEAPPEKKSTRKLRPCGTLAAYRRHLRNHEVPCHACAEASRIDARRRRGLPDPPPLLPHGTHAAYTRHYTARTAPCDECIAAEREYQREAKRRQRALQRERKAA